MEKVLKILGVAGVGHYRGWKLSE